MLLCISSSHSSHLPYAVTVLCSAETAAMTLEHSPLCCDCSSTDDMKDNICFVLKYVDIFHTCELLLCCDTLIVYVCWETTLWNFKFRCLHFALTRKMLCVVRKHTTEERGERSLTWSRMSTLSKWKWDGRVTIKLISFWLPFIFLSLAFAKSNFSTSRNLFRLCFHFFFIAIKFFLFLISVMSGRRSTQRNDVEFIFAWEMFSPLIKFFRCLSSGKQKLLIKKRMTEVHNHTICGG